MFLPGYDPPGAAADDYARRVRGLGGGQVGAAATWPGPERGSMKATLARSRPLRARIHTPGRRGGRRSARRSGFDQARRARNAAALTRLWQDVEQNRLVPLREVST